MSEIIQENPRAGEYIIRELDKEFCAEEVTVAAGDYIKAGTVLGIVTATGEYAPYANTNTDGTETAKAILRTPLKYSADPRPAVVTARLTVVTESKLFGLDANAKADLSPSFIIFRP